MRYRSRTDITAQILESANGRGVTKTKVMYGAFLSYAQLKEYLSMLVDNKLIEHDQQTQTYKTTAKGLKFIGLRNDLGTLVLEPQVSELAHM